jgi:hypothetical protein
LQLNTRRNEDRPGHNVEFVQDIVVKDSQYPQSLLLHVIVSPLISLACGIMTHAVEFDNERNRVAVEIGDEWSNWMLAAKLQATQLAAAEDAPEDSLGCRGIASKASSSLDRIVD